MAMEFKRIFVLNHTKMTQNFVIVPIKIHILNLSDWKFISERILYTYLFWK